MNFHFNQNDRLPRLAWCARIEKAVPSVVIEHGQSVETRETFFVEGVWDGPFDQGRFDISDALLGSGARLGENAVVFCPTSHSMDRLYSIRLDSELYVSNSLVYVLHAARQWLDLSEWRYEFWLMSFLMGLDKAIRQIRIGDGVLGLHYCHTVTVDSSLTMTEQSRPMLPTLHCYDDFVTTLRQYLLALHDNAAHPDRALPFSPLATISSGYDSSACAVLAEAIACREALNVSDSRPHSNISVDDSGGAIEKLLNLTVHRARRNALNDIDGFPEAEFLATGNGGDDVILALFADQLPGRMLITGFLGGQLWDTVGTDPKRSIHQEFTYPPGATLNEFRLRLGFVHLPIPLLVYTRHPNVLAISRSDEMMPWRLGGNYDRPIPRRILEERGLRRGTFATNKNAVTVPMWSVSDASTIMTDRSIADLAAYVATHCTPNLPSRVRYWRDRALSPLEPLCSQAWYWRITKAARMLSGEIKSRNVVWCRYSSLNNALKFHWATQKVRPRYETTCFADKSAHSPVIQLSRDNKPKSNWSQ